MLVIPGRRCHTCEGPTRRELLRAGSIGMLGLNLANFLAWQKTAEGRHQIRRRARLRQRQVGDHGLPAGRPQPHRHLGSQARRARQHPRRLQAHPHQDPRHPHRRAHADDGQGARQGHAHPLDELHAQRPVQSHRGDLPDADRLSAGPRVALGPARAAQPRRLSHRRQPRLQAEAAQGSGAALRRTAAPAAGIGRHRQGRRGRLPRQGLRSLPPLSGPRQAHQDRRSRRCARRCRRSVSKDRFELLKGINDSMPDLEKALKSYAIDEYYGKAFDLVLSGKARDAFDLTKEPDKSASATA